jgi:hypothetical protein
LSDAAPQAADFAPQRRARFAEPARFALALFVLNAMLTFENLWGTAAVRFGPRLSIDLCVALAGLVAWVAWTRRLPGRKAVWALSLLALLWVLARYADVTAPAVFGRRVNLYWDLPHAWDVLRLAAAGAPLWQVVAFAVAAAGIAAAIGWLASRCITQIARGVHGPWLCAGLGLLLVPLLISFVVYPWAGRDTRWFFALPIAPSIWREAVVQPITRLAGGASAVLPPSPSFDADLGALHGADVLVIFAESYGVTSFERPAQAATLATSREALQGRLGAAGLRVVTGRVRSPTFGGASWLAHGALLSGLDTSDPADHDLLLSSHRPTLVSHFAAHGWRTVAWMPGLQRPWPEGSFFGFDRIADADGVGYRGPSFGYWRIPDQAAIGLLQAQELSQPRPRSPRFIMFPTLSTHAPFVPLAPSKRAATALLGTDAYSAAERDAAVAEPASWRAPQAAYLRSFEHFHAWLGRYLADEAPSDMLTIVIGDHQPYAAVSGPDAPWDVPVHVFSRDAGLIERFRARGFVDGLQPPALSLGGMHELTPWLVNAFSGAQGAAPQHWR